MELPGCHPEPFLHSSHLGEYGIAVFQIVFAYHDGMPFIACCS
jgi:hypothetical protein